MSRTKNTIRMLELLSFRRVVSLNELTSVLEVNPRTIQRMKDDLLELGYDIETIYGPGGGYRLIGTSDLNLGTFSDEDRKHILNGLNQLMDISNLTYTKDYYAAISKLNHHFDQSSQTTQIQTASSKVLNIEDPKQYLNNVSTIKDAIKRTKRIRIEYTNQKNETRQYLFEPYELYIVNQIWYVGGLNEKGALRSLKLTRMTSCEIDENSTFRYDEPTAKMIKVDNYGFKIDPIRIKVKIQNKSYFKEYIWGENQVITDIDENTYHLEVTFLNRLSAESFLLEGGHHFTVLEPKSLQEWIQEEAKKVLGNYT